jgi:ABC-type multidrug transport system fused ATPase/permease subunit
VVRLEALLTQLVFEHALKIRMTSESSVENTLSKGNMEARQPGKPDEGDANRASMPSDATAVDGPSTSATRSPTPNTASSSTNQGGEKAKQAPSPTEFSAKGEKNKNLAGKINNLVSVDQNNIIEGREFLLPFLLAPIQITLAVVFLYNILGWSTFVGLGVMVILLPAPGYLARKLQKFEKAKMSKTDARIQSVTELVGVIRMIKLFGWETKMRQRIADTRNEELRYILLGRLVSVGTTALNYTIPSLTMIASFAAFTLVMKQELTASVAFAAMTVFDILKELLYMVFGIMPGLIRAKVSIDRLDEFLNEVQVPFNSTSTCMLKLSPF